MEHIEGKRIDPKKLGPRWKLHEEHSPGTKLITGTILTDRNLGMEELLESGVFSFGGSPLQVLLHVTIYLDDSLTIADVTVDACGGSVDMLGPPVDCDTTDEDEGLVETTIRGFLKD